MPRAARILLLAFAPAVLATANPALSQAAPASIDEKRGGLFPVSPNLGATDDFVLFKINGVPYTRAEVRLIMAVAPSETFAFANKEMILNLPVQGLRALAIELGVRKLAAERARAEGMTFVDEARQKIETAVDGYIVSRMRTARIAPLVKPVTPEALAQYYEQQRARFRVDERYDYRLLLLPAYRDVTAAQGETLELIATRVSKDPAAVQGILAKATKRPRSQDTSPLKPGEVLMVPLGTEERAELKKKAEQLLTELRAKGAPTSESFREVAKSAGGNEAPGELLSYLPSAGKPVAPTLLDALKATPVGQVSAPFETRHGVNLVFVEKKQAAGFQPLEEVQPTLEQELRRLANVAAETEYLEAALAAPDSGFRVRRPDDSPEPVIAWGSTSWLASELKPAVLDAIQQASDAEMKDSKEMARRLASIPDFRLDALRRHAFMLPLAEGPEVDRARAYAEEEALARQWMSRELARYEAAGGTAGTLPEPRGLLVNQLEVWVPDIPEPNPDRTFAPPQPRRGS